MAKGREDSQAFAMPQQPLSAVTGSLAARMIQSSLQAIPVYREGHD